MINSEQDAEEAANRKTGKLQQQVRGQVI